ncbi:hypothetical protein [Rahnella inusitata]|uniref:Uncharacterized protein n=1 Tax=Rahnella inusitata TaxID=58169 RepID=A0ABX9NYX8_9GAMM|nr:hypothetical protein [Rahnella inusitata]RJT12776.1 hypothetical protein D5396_12380 [Rahnella inusitata]
MPIHDTEYQDALDFFYESDSDEVYFSASEEQPVTAEIPFFKKNRLRDRRKASKRVTQQKLVQHPFFSAANVLPRLPDFIPPFNDRTVSAKSIPPSPQPKPEKRWRSSNHVFAEPETSRGAIKKGGSAPKFTQNEPRWTVDMSELTSIDLDGAAMKKYQEFVRAVNESNMSPLDINFEKRRWDIKLTNQKDKYELWSGRLSKDKRMKFIVRQSEHKVMMFSVGKHDK